MTLARRPPPELFKLSTNQWTQPFWDATARHALVAAQCADCGHFRMPPTPFCPRCQSQQLRWTPLAGGAQLYSYTIVERAILPGMELYLPYVPAVVTLDGAGGARLISNVVDVDIAALRIGMRLRLVWDDVPEAGVAVPRFVPAAD